MKKTCLLGLALSSTTSALIGYGKSMYDPPCAFACRDIFSGAMLACSGHDHATGAHSHGQGATSPECYASDTPWLTTLANCINMTCTDTAPWKLEKYWTERVTGRFTGVLPNWTYQETLVQMQGTEPPSRLLEEDEMLNFTASYDEETWESTRGALQSFEAMEVTHSRYGIVLLVVSFATPIVTTCLGHLPYMTLLLDKLKPRFVWPSLMGTYHVRALPFTLGNAPTIGQTWYILLFLVLNIAFTAGGYRSFQYPANAWFPDAWQEIMAYMSNRTGVLAFALAPLVILFSGRNNVLLWLTSWSHSTYMLLHRWVARIFTLQIILHSILELILYKRKGSVDAEQKEPYWIWGIVATIASVIMIVISSLWFRRKSYEIFLIIHIILAVFVLAGSWYHVELLFSRRWGYEFWIYAACAVWFFDRGARVARILKNGMRRAEVTQVTHDIVRIDIKGVRWDATPGRHTYAYFPSVNPLRPWENHPFSIVPTALLRLRHYSLAASSSSSSSEHEAAVDIEKSGTATAINARLPHSLAPTDTSGISLYVRKSTGITKALAAHKSLLTLLDGPYPNNSTAAVLRTDRLVLIAGGIGISAVLPFIAQHHNVSIHWSLKAADQGLANDLATFMDGIKEKHVHVGERFDVGAVLGREKGEGWNRIGVVVCGPGGMCDEVRSSVSQRARESSRTRWELDVEAFSW
ncbi:ferric reductase like transmembrane component-domain-containing protein [Boeremia exigua]|uniref:ferric reductase like transmembrane component-domain-containing protein n=1 Tax=Boeremia exigua TaxID=749465 RepID=UPI001E8E5386|nr:ferric reductase like transmembrane component-domain-containing protein [Boeremia exigua]KAH6625273.1 ferric reductase like transmembrane component-domain-containing protein [Boeremia exigua]